MRYVARFESGINLVAFNRPAKARGAIASSRMIDRQHRSFYLLRRLYIV